MINRNEVDKILSKRRFNAERSAASSYETALKDAEFSSVEGEIRSLTLDSIKTKQDKSDKIKELTRKRDEVLKKLHMTYDDFTPKYYCAKCNDTGRNKDGTFCSCYKSLLSSLVATETGFENYTLKNFDDSVFSNETFGQKLHKFIESYINKFDSTKKRNILLIGDSGTGKTFALSCILNELMRSGVNAMYSTAFNLNKIFLAYHTTPNKEKGEEFNALLEADLLIIDDLGTEPLLKNVTLEYLFSLLNDRNLNKKHTLFSTNLDLDELLNRYDERIMSRLIDKSCTTVIEMQGEDIRHK